MTEVKKDQLPARRRSAKSSQLISVTMTIPVTLNKRLEERMAKRQDSKSLVATILMEKGLEVLEAQEG